MGWRHIGSQLFAMTLGQMSWGQGLPWFCNKNFTQALFPNMNWGQVGDSVQFNSDTKSSSTKSEAERKLEREEKEAKNREQAFEKRQLTKKFDKLKPLLTEFQKTLNEDVREEFDLIEDIKKCTKSVTKDNYEKMLEIYNANKTKINEAKEKAVKEKLTSANNKEYTTTVTTLNIKIGDLSDGKFEILDGDNELKKEIDIMELLSTWNSNSTTKDSHIMKTIGGKYKTATGENKSKYETLVNVLHNKLETAAENIDEKKLSDATKEALKKAQDDLAKFDTSEKRFPKSEDECGKNYSNAFDNLYRAIRLAEAEIVEKELKEGFDFLGDENPYKTSTIVADTKTDLKNEGLNNARQVTEPVAPSVPSGAKEIKLGSTSYYILKAENSTPEYYKADKTKMPENEFKNTVGVVEIKENGCYSITNESGTTYYKDDHTKTNKETFNATSPDANASGAGTGSLGSKYEEGKAFGQTFKNYIRGGTRDSKAYDELREKLNKESVIGILEAFYTDNTTVGIIEDMGNSRFDIHNRNRVVKALMRKAAEIPEVSESSEYKALVDFFGAKGSMKYNQDGTIHDDDDFKFTKNNEAGKSDSITNRQKIDDMIEALLKKIKSTVST